ncbi:hypothetical protein BO86DRAFT_390777, partial [Aspergillus japonicus CBS 114.51]
MSSVWRLGTKKKGLIQSISVVVRVQAKNLTCKKVVPGIEPGLQESESWVLTITLHNQLSRNGTMFAFVDPIIFLEPC